MENVEYILECTTSAVMLDGELTVRQFRRFARDPARMYVISDTVLGAYQRYVESSGGGRARG